MKYLNFALINILLVVVWGCHDSHLIKNREYRGKVDASFSQAEILAQNRKEQLFSVFDSDLTIHQKEALKFLYAFMPLNNLILVNISHSYQLTFI